MPKSKQLYLVVNQYFNQRPNTGRYWPELKARFDRQVIPHLGKYTLIDTVSKQDIRELLQKIGKRYPAAARTLWDALGPFFKFCLSEDYISASPILTLSPPSLVPSRDRVLTESEIKQFWEATDDDWYWSSFFRILLLTGQRRQEIALLSSSNISDRLDIPAAITKTKTANSIPILPLLQKEFAKAQWLGKAPSGFSKAKTKLDDRLSFQDWRVHDLRRTFRTYLAMLDVSDTVAELLINHKIKGIQGVYNRYKYQKEKQEALERYYSFILSLTSSKK